MKFTKIKENLYKGDNEELYQLHKVSNTKGVMKLAYDLGISGLDVYDVLRRAKSLLIEFQRKIPSDDPSGLKLVLLDIEELLLDDPHSDPEEGEEEEDEE